MSHKKTFSFFSRLRFFFLPSSSSSPSKPKPADWAALLNSAKTCMAAACYLPVSTESPAMCRANTKVRGSWRNWLKEKWGEVFRCSSTSPPPFFFPLSFNTFLFAWRFSFPSSQPTRCQ